MKFRIYRKLVLIVFLIEFAFGLFETNGAYQCHYHAECWPWFFTLIVNFPASVIVYQIPFDLIGNTDTPASILITSGLFVIVGTLWWSLLLHTVTYIFFAFRKVFSNSNHQ